MRVEPTKSEVYVKGKIEKLLGIKLESRDKPDLQCKIGGKDIGIEVVIACDKIIQEIENTRNKDRVPSLCNKFNKSSKAKAHNAEISYVGDEYVSTCWISDPMYSICTIQECIDAKDKKVYSGFDELWLAILCQGFVSIFPYDLLKDELYNIRSEQFKKIIIIDCSEAVYELDMKTQPIKITEHIGETC